MPENEETARYGGTHFGRLAARYLLRYVRGDRSIDIVYGIRRATKGTFMIGDSPLSVDENGDVTILVTYEGKRAVGAPDQDKCRSISRHTLRYEII
jgi:hypothetical protein